MNKLLLVSLLAGTALFGAAATTMAEEVMVYGRELMTQQELAEHRTKIRSFRTEQEREAYRQEHHEQMKVRAQERGVTLPDAPLPRGAGRGLNRGSGRGP